MEKYPHTMLDYQYAMEWYRKRIKIMIKLCYFIINQFKYTRKFMEK